MQYVNQSDLRLSRGGWGDKRIELWGMCTLSSGQGASTSYASAIGTAYAFSSGEALTIQSSSALDKGDGAGVKTVRIYGLDASGDQAEVDVTLSGTGSVAIGNWKMVHTMEALSHGAYGCAFGDITCESGYPSYETYAKIRAKYLLNDQARTIIPAGKTGYLRDILLEGTEGSVFCIHTYDGIKSGVADAHTPGHYIYLPRGYHEFRDPIKYEAGKIISVRVPYVHTAGAFSCLGNLYIK
jgi:hypothetical protein